MYHCDDCGREGTPRMLGRVLVCYCGSLELRWLASPASPPSPPSRVELLESTPTKTTIRAVFKPPTSFDRFINNALTLAELPVPETLEAWNDVAAAAECELCKHRHLDRSGDWGCAWCPCGHRDGCPCGGCSEARR